MTRGARRLSLGPRAVVALVAVAAAGGAAVWWRLASSGPASSAAVERTVTVSTGTMRQTVTASGTVAAAATEDLNFSVAGKVTTLTATAGQKVTKGEVLATVDSAALQSAVAQAEATLASAEARRSTDTASGAGPAQLAADSATVTAASAALAGARSSLAGATLVSPIDGTVASVNLAVGQQLGGSGNSATSLTGSGTGSGQTRASSGSTAPATGGGGAASAGSGAATPSTAEIEVVDTSSFVVDLGVDDTQIGRIAVGQPATVSLSSSAAITGGGRFAGFGAGGGGFGGGFGGGAGGFTGGAAAAGGGTPAGAAPGAAAGASAPVATATATGTVTSVGVVATSTSGVATFPVVVTLSGPGDGFHAGASASVAITYQELPNVLEVPVAAVTRSGGRSTVTVSAHGKKTARTVVTGVTAGGQVQVTSGLTAGEQVVVRVPVAATGGGPPTGGTGRTGNRTFGAD